MSYAIDTCIVDYLASNGPADETELYQECRMQVTSSRVTRKAVREVIERLMLMGSIEWYDNDESTGAYDLASGEL